MTYYYSQGNAYDIIQLDVENYFHKEIKKEKVEIKNIVIVGAYHGYEIFRLLNLYPNCIIHAFEAVPKHYKVLVNNFKDNPRVKIYNKAISDCIEDVNFYELGNGGEGSGSLLKFLGHELGHPFRIEEVIKVKSSTLKNELGDIEIDLLWVDVQGAELKVLKGANLNKCKCLFLEIHTHDFIKPWDERPYDGMCFKEDLENYLQDFILYSIGLDNEAKNGQGNSFWINKLYEKNNIA